MEKPVCIGCGKTPEQLEEYVEGAADYGHPITPDDYCRLEEGTYSEERNRFACTTCYVAMGCPSSPTGWKA